MVDRTKRSETDFEGVMKEICDAIPVDGDEDLFMEELTLKVQLDGTPIYRTFNVIDRCSLLQLERDASPCF